MSDFTFNPKYITKADDVIVDAIVSNLKELKKFKGLGLEKTYIINYIGPNTIRYVGEKRSKGKPEEMSFDDVSSTFRVLKSMSVFNTNKELLKEKFSTSMFRQRSNLFAILLEAGIIIRV